MNHFKTVFSFSFCLLLMSPSTSYGKLQRSLKPNEIKSLAQNIRKNPKNIKSRLFLANHYFDQKKWATVVSFLSPVVEKLPDEAIYQLARSYFNQGNNKLAKTTAGILISRPKVETKSQLLMVDIQSKDLEEELDTIRQKTLSDKIFASLKETQIKDPENRLVYEKWIEMLEKHVSHHALDALSVIEDMKKHKVVLYPKDYSNLCRFNHMAQFTKATTVTCQQAMVKDPDNPNNLIYLGQTHIENGDNEKGQRMLASVAKKYSQHEEALWASGMNYYKNKNISKAYELFKKAVRHPEAKPRDFLGLGMSAFELKKYSLALKSFVAHCKRSGVLSQEFRRASGLLKDEPQWQNAFRQKMMDCKSQK